MKLLKPEMVDFFAPTDIKEGLARTNRAIGLQKTTMNGYWKARGIFGIQFRTLQVISGHKHTQQPTQVQKSLHCGKEELEIDRNCFIRGKTTIIVFCHPFLVEIGHDGVLEFQHTFLTPFSHLEAYYIAETGLIVSWATQITFEVFLSRQVMPKFAPITQQSIMWYLHRFSFLFASISTRLCTEGSAL